MPPKKQRREVLHARLGELNDSKGIGIPAVHAIGTSTDFEHDKCSTTAQLFIPEQGKDSYCHRASTTVGLPARRITTTGGVLWFALHPLMGQYKGSFYVTTTVPSISLALYSIGGASG